MGGRCSSSQAGHEQFAVPSHPISVSTTEIPAGHLELDDVQVAQAAGPALRCHLVAQSAKQH